MRKTICLAVSPSLKAYGLPGRARLFEVISKLKELNHQREPLEGSSFLASNLNKNKHKAIDYIIAKPRMSLYLEYSTRIYSIYLKYFSPDDIHVYSIDEVFIDATHYLDTYELDAFHLVQNIIYDIYKEVGITVTAGIGTNLYLAKVAMDIVAKHKEPDEKGARIAYLNTYAYRKLLWSHTPLNDFWRVGKGISTKLNNIGLYTMGDIARCSLEDEEKLYNLFGVNAELLIDHAWGWEPCTMAAIKAYKAPSKSIGTGQVLSCAYDYKKTEIILKEISDVINGKVVQEDDTFYIVKNDGRKIDFSLEAEGMRKLGLLWKLIRNGLLEKNSVLLWDEPEANLNPELYPLVANILLALQKNGVQIFLATHSYNFAKYLEIRRTEKEQVLIHNLYRNDLGKEIMSVSAYKMEDLEPNHIMMADNQLLDEVYNM